MELSLSPKIRLSAFGHEGPELCDGPPRTRGSEEQRATIRTARGDHRKRAGSKPTIRAGIFTS
jgi:hypothetical protein